MKVLLVALFTLSVLSVSGKDDKKKYTPTMLLQAKIDSVNGVLKSEFRKHQLKVDSLHNANYMKALEKSNELQSGNNEQYSNIFSIMSWFLGAVTVIFTFNWFYARRDYQTKLKAQREEHDRITDKQTKAFDKFLDEQKKGIQDYLKQVEEKVGKQEAALKLLHQKNEEVINKLIGDVQSSLKELEAKEPAVKEEQVKPAQAKSAIEKLQEQVDDLRKIAKPIDIPSGLREIGKNYRRLVPKSDWGIVKCEHCFHPIMVPPPSTSFVPYFAKAICNSCGEETVYNPKIVFDL